MREEIREPSVYYTIVGGTFRAQVSEGDPNAVRREWESTDKKRSGVKYERIINAIIGYITKIQFFDSEYGMQLVISLDKDDNGKTPKIALQAASREGESFMKRLPNIDFKKEVKLRPFSFTDQQDGEEVRGMDVTQADELGEFTVKIKNFFRDEEAKKNINGFPDPEGNTEEYSKDDWKMYFLQCRKFLITYTKEQVIPRIPYFDSETVGRPTAAEARAAVTKDMPGAPEYPTEEINPDDIPF